MAGSPSNRRPAIEITKDLLHVARQVVAAFEM
jgi:hypothetical protein